MHNFQFPDFTHPSDLHPIVDVPTEVQNRGLTVLCMSQFCVT